MTWLYSDLFIPRGRPMRIHSPNDDGWRIRILIDSVPNLNKLVKLESRILDFREEIPSEERLKIYEWVMKNYKPPPPKP